MIGSNATITSYRLYKDAEGKSSYSPVKTVNGIEVRLDREQEEAAALVGIENVFDVFRLESDRELDIQESDQVRDNTRTFTVHTVMREYDPAYGNYTVCILKLHRG